MIQFRRIGFGFRILVIELVKKLVRWLYLENSFLKIGDRLIVFGEKLKEVFNFFLETRTKGAPIR